ncbi:hypothetical protein QOT17_010534 [Balamuthia mandrillaris]
MVFPSSHKIAQERSPSSRPYYKPTLRVKVDFNLSSCTIYDSKQRCVAVIPKLKGTHLNSGLDVSVISASTLPVSYLWPSLAHLRTSGCSAFVHVPKSQRNNNPVPIDESPYMIAYPGDDADNSDEEEDDDDDVLGGGSKTLRRDSSNCCTMSNQTKSTAARKVRTCSARADNPKRRRTQEKEQVFEAFTCEGLFLGAENKENLETFHKGACIADVSEAKPFLLGKDCKKVVVTPCVEEETLKGVVRDRLAEVLDSVLQRLDDLEAEVAQLKTSNKELTARVAQLKTSNKELTARASSQGMPNSPGLSCVSSPEPRCGC